MISIVIPAYNEEKHLAKTLESIVKQETAQKFEVIVVDNNSTDRTKQVALSFKKILDIRVIEEKLKGRSPARRAGFAHAKGSIIFSTDADIIVPPDWIEKITTHFADPSIAAVTGTCYMNDCSWLVNANFSFYYPISMMAFRSAFGHYWLSGFNFAIRKSIYKKSGGFDPVLNSHEDTDLALRVRKYGKIKFIRSPRVLFSGRRFQNGYIHGLYQYTASLTSYYVFKDYRRVYLSDVREK